MARWGKGRGAFTFKPTCALERDSRYREHLQLLPTFLNRWWEGKGGRSGNGAKLLGQALIRFTSTCVDVDVAFTNKTKRQANHSFSLGYYYQRQRNATTLACPLLSLSTPTSTSVQISSPKNFNSTMAACAKSRACVQLHRPSTHGRAAVEIFAFQYKVYARQKQTFVDTCETLVAALNQFVLTWELRAAHPCETMQKAAICKALSSGATKNPRVVLSCHLVARRCRLID